VFSHGWPLSADDWDNQMLFFLNQGYRVIAMTAAATAAPPRPATAMTWITTPTISRP
jgi:pimeloyl-ACP methyl ester carboxylesterase